LLSCKQIQQLCFATVEAIIKELKSFFWCGAAQTALDVWRNPVFDAIGDPHIPVRHSTSQQKQLLSYHHQTMT